MKTLAGLIYLLVTKSLYFLHSDFFAPQNGHHREIQDVLGRGDTCLVRA